MSKDDGRFTPRAAAEGGNPRIDPVSAFPWDITGNPVLPQPIRVNNGNHICLVLDATATNRTFADLSEKGGKERGLEQLKTIAQHHLGGEALTERAGTLRANDTMSPTVYVHRPGKSGNPSAFTVYFLSIGVAEAHPMETLVLIAGCKVSDEPRLLRALPGYHPDPGESKARHSRSITL